MKTLKTLATVLLTTIALNAFADNKPAGKIKKPAKTVLAVPTTSWGNPEDVNSGTVESLKNLYRVSSPEMVWGSPQDVNSNSVASLKNLTPIAAPALVWGDPADVNSPSVKALKTNHLNAPEMVWGGPEDFDAASVELLKQVNK